MIRQTLEHLAAILQQVDELDQEIERTIQSDPQFAQSAPLLTSIPGFNAVSAAETVAEVGAT